MISSEEKREKTKIIIVGGGFAGLYAAMYFDKGLARQQDIEVTLISRENFILFTPMLHEVAAGDLYPGDIVNPLRRILRYVRVVQAEVQQIDLAVRRIRYVHGIERQENEREFHHLILALGSETNFFDMKGVKEWAATMKNLNDAALLRNRLVALLEEASLQCDESVRQQMLTFVTAGGGFAGVETTGAVNDFVRDTARYYPGLSEDAIRVIVVHPGDFLLPELGEELGRYTERMLIERGVEVIKGVRVVDYDGSVITLNDGTRIPAETLIWTAGVKPSPVIAQLPCRKERGRLLVNEFLAVAGVPGVWAVGDCAAVPNPNTGDFHPPTAQHGLREGVVAAKNIEATILGRPLKPFEFTTLGQLASIGHHTGVAMMFGIKFSGFIAWFLWRTVYLMKLPRLPKKLRVMVSWALELLFGREIEQIITLREAEALAEFLHRLRARGKETVQRRQGSTHAIN